MIGVFGSKEGIYNEPDGYFLPPPKPRLHELMVKRPAISWAFPLSLQGFPFSPAPSTKTAAPVSFAPNAAGL